jgi:nicotinamide riboside kinase
VHGAKIHDYGVGLGRNRHYYNFVYRKMRTHKPFIITIVGPESSGKTTLARQLAADLGCPWVPEYARDYLQGLGRTYDMPDLEIIAQGQLEAIFNASRVQVAIGSEQVKMALKQTLEIGIGTQDSISAPGKNEGGTSYASGGRSTEPHVLGFQAEEFGDEPRPIIVVDSGMMSIRMWARIKYNTAIPAVEEALREDITSLYVLCRPVHPWEPDPLREAPSLVDRAWIYNRFLEEMFMLQAR